MGLGSTEGRVLKVDHAFVATDDELLSETHPVSINNTKNKPANEALLITSARIKSTAFIFLSPPAISTAALPSLHTGKPNGSHQLRGG
jgi:hypothetical protein